MSHKYELGGNWINIRLPMYVVLDRKPEYGCKIQNLCDEQSEIMLRLLLVKLQNSLICPGSDLAAEDVKKEFLNHGMQVLKYFV